MNTSADIVICGAGMAGVAAAYHLAARPGARRIILIDEREPLTLTSDKGTQGYRNWWPGPDDTMLRFVSRSIDIMEEMANESGNAIRLSRHGYLFATAEASGVDALRSSAAQVSGYGMGAVREHPGGAAYQAAPLEGFRDQPTGADLLLGDDLHRAFPFLSPTARAGLHVRRAGWMDGIAMGAWMLRRALGSGVTFVSDRVESVDTDGGRVRSVRLASGDTIETERLVLAAGPKIGEAAKMLGVDLPVFHELHAKVTMRDHLGVIPRNAPFTIWNDLVGQLPGGVHIRPIDGPFGDELFLIWTYHTAMHPAVWPPSFDPEYAETCLRGASVMAPGLNAYLDRGGHGAVDGGYYCKTAENRPLIGPLAVEGAYVLAALSGFGIMASHAGADLLAAHVTGAPLPDYAKWFLPSRYDDPSYRQTLRAWGALTGQL